MDPSEGEEMKRNRKSLERPSGGSSLEHLPQRAVPQPTDKGRQRELINTTGKLWRIRSGEKEVRPLFTAGNELSKCQIASQSLQKTAFQTDDGKHSLREKNGEDRAFQESFNQVQAAGLRADLDTSVDSRLGKKKHRRGNSKKKRNWKPYNKLSWEEKKALEERETVRASRIREEMFAKGLPVAPYNTTQFLMDEHDREEPDLNTETGVKRSLSVAGRMEDTVSEEEMFDNEEEEEDDGSGGGSDGIGRAGNAGGEFLQRDFSETYEMYHVESLQNMTKQELVQEYLELEKCMSRLEEENNRLRLAVEPEGSVVRLREMELELQRLRAENSELILKNQTTDNLKDTTN